MQLSQTAQDEAEGLPTYFDGAFRGGGMKIDAKDAIAKCISQRLFVLSVYIIWSLANLVLDFLS